jgi:sulfoxide reductase heme-binding subunit YedZ
MKESENTPPSLGVSGSIGPRDRTAIAVALCAMAATVAVSIIATSIAAYPTAAEGWRHAARYTARFSFVVFLLVFVARPWHELWPSNRTRWAVRNRRAIGLAFATAHFIHLYALTRFRLDIEQLPNLGPLIRGSGAYVLLAAMAATSNDSSVRLLGARNWKRLHTVGIYWIWFFFVESYVTRIASGRLFFVPFVVVAVAALSLRIAARVRTRSRARLSSVALSG